MDFKNKEYLKIKKTAIEKITSFNNEIVAAKIRKSGNDEFILKLTYHIPHKKTHLRNIAFIFKETHIRKTFFIKSDYVYLHEVDQNVLSYIFGEFKEKIMEIFDYETCISSYEGHYTVNKPSNTVFELLENNNFIDFKNFGLNINLFFNGIYGKYIYLYEKNKKYENMFKEVLSMKNFINNYVLSLDNTHYILEDNETLNKEKKASENEISFYISGAEFNFKYSIFNNDQFPSIFIENENKHFFTYEEFEIFFKNLIKDFKKNQRIKNILNPPRNHFDEKLNKSWFKENKDDIYNYLKNDFSPEEIEKAAVDFAIERSHFSFYNPSKNLNFNDDVDFLELMGKFFVISNFKNEYDVNYFSDKNEAKIFLNKKITEMTVIFNEYINNNL